MVKSWWLCTWLIWTDKTGKFWFSLNKLKMHIHLIFYDQLMQPNFLLFCQLSVLLLTGNSNCGTISLGVFWSLKFRFCMPRAKWIGMISWFRSTALVSWLPVDSFRPVRFSVIKLKRMLNFIIICCNTPNGIAWFMSSVNNYTKEFFIALCWKNYLILGQGRKYIGAFPVHKKSFTNATVSK